MYALIDGNTFYASCERVFQPYLRHLPVVVLSNNDGCIVTLTKEAKRLGLKRGTPLFQVKEIIDRNNVQVFSSNYELYGDMSARMMRTIASLVPEIEVYSIDECFADVSGLGNFTQLGHEIRARVLKWIGIPTCVGIAPTKTLAKLCNHIAKTYTSLKGVFNWEDLTPARQTKALSTIPVKDIWGIGTQLSKKLNLLGIETALDLKNADSALIRKHFGVVLLRTQTELRGIPAIPFEPKPPARQQICCSRSFAKNCYEIDGVLSALAVHVSHACRRLRKQKSRCQTVTVFVYSNVFNANDPQHAIHESFTLKYPTADTGKITTLVSLLVRQAFMPGIGYKKAGVILSDLSSEDEPYMVDLFDVPEVIDEKREKLMAVLDALSERFGKNVLYTGMSALSDAASMRRECLSRCYTTRVEDVLRVS